MQPIDDERRIAQGNEARIPSSTSRAETPASQTPNIEFLNRLHTPDDVLMMFVEAVWALMPSTDKVDYSSDSPNAHSVYRSYYDEAMAAYEAYQSMIVTGTFEERGRLFLRAFTFLRSLLTDLQFLHQRST